MRRPFSIAILVALTIFATMVGPVRAQEEEAETGNNLSVPVIWSDGVAKVLRGTYGEPAFNGESFLLDGVRYYLQQDPNNTWQAQSVSGAVGTPPTPVNVSWVDWGDNLEAKAWSETSVVRVETVLLQDLATPMLGFEMGYLWGEGTTEMWGADTKTYDSLQATVYSGAARLVIQKLLKEPSAAMLAWDPVNARWTGDANAPVFSHGVWEAGEGKPTDRYSAEINIPGKVVYGYNWNLRQTGEGAGYYRLTFVIDANAAIPLVNTSLSTAQIVPPSEEETEGEDSAEEDGAPGGGGVAAVDPANNLTYIDVQILPSSGRRGGSGGRAISETSLTADMTAPRPAGTSVTFTASATGGVRPIHYKFFVFDGVDWLVAQAWSPSATFEWTPTTASPNYRIGVWARSADGTLDAPETDGAFTSIAFPIVGVPPVRMLNLAPNVLAPRLVGTTVTFSAAAQSGVPPYQYKWWVHDGTAWTAVLDWNSSSTFAWTPSTANPAYRVGVWVRSAGNTLDAPEGPDSYMSMPFAIVTGAVVPLTVTSLKADPAAPQTAGTTIEFTATATGGTPPYQYRWWVFDGTAWTVELEWTSSATLAWTPLTPSDHYRVGVWVRSAGSTSNATETPTSFSSVAYVVYEAPELTVAGITADVDLPRPTGTTILFTAAATGGKAPYESQWWVFDGTTWSIVRNWSSDMTFEWTPMTSNPDYRVGVWMRSSGNTSAGHESMHSFKSLPVPIVPSE